LTFSGWSIEDAIWTPFLTFERSPPPLIATSEGPGILSPGLSRPILEVFP